MLCPRCNGFGNLVIRNGTEYELCPACRGQGRVEDSQYAPWKFPVEFKKDDKPKLDDSGLRQ